MDETRWCDDTVDCFDGSDEPDQCFLGQSDSVLSNFSNFTVGDVKCDNCYLCVAFVVDALLMLLLQRVVRLVTWLAMVNV